MPFAVFLGILLACAAEGDAGSDGGATTSVSATSSTTDASTGTTSASGSAGSSGTTSAGGSGAGSSGGSSSGGVTCGLDPAATWPWLTSMQDDVVARLSGHAELEPGVTLADRATATNRALARAFLAARLEELGLETFTQDYAASAGNVYGRLPATTGSARHLVLGAHFDSVPGGPGANDNATGIALVLGVAQRLRDEPCRDATVLFAFFDEEEVGLVGSDAFAQRLAGSGLEIESVHTVDQMGWDADGDRAVEIERPDPGLFAIYEAAVDSSGYGVPLVETQTGSTDHVSFRNYGFAAAGITEEYVSGDTTPHYHQATDTYDTVDFEYLASTTRLVAHAFDGLLQP